MISFATKITIDWRERKYLLDHFFYDGVVSVEKKKKKIDAQIFFSLHRCMLTSLKIIIRIESYRMLFKLDRLTSFSLHYLRIC